MYASVATRLVCDLRRGKTLSAYVYHGLRRLAQYGAERRSAYARLETLKQDRRLEQILAFSGRGE